MRKEITFLNTAKIARNNSNRVAHRIGLMNKTALCGLKMDSFVLIKTEFEELASNKHEQAHLQLSNLDHN